MKRRRLTLTRRTDGRTYLDRWGFECKFGGVYVHHITAPDPGLDVHDHPFWFASFIMRGGYTEIVQEVRTQRIQFRVWGRWTWHTVRLDQAHRIRWVDSDTWTLVIRGPRVRGWGFYEDGVYVPEEEYRGTQRDLDVR